MSDFLELAKTSVKKIHDATGNPQRWGRVDTDGSVSTQSGGCFYSFRDTVQHSYEYLYPYIFSAFHGDGAILSFDALRNDATFNKEMMAHTQPFDKFIGTERTEKWLSFLLSGASPWRHLMPFIETGPSFVNDAGFVYSTPAKAPAKLLYNFVMGYRFPWEMPRGFGHWLLLQEKIDPAMALYVALNFSLCPEAESIDGPYDVIYPWSCLEETMLEAAARFILARPGTVNHGEETHPNVEPLWQVTGTLAEKARKGYDAMMAKDTLLLPDILTILEERMHEFAQEGE